MSLGTCIPDMVERGEISAEKGQEMGQLFDELHQDFRRQFGDQAADAMASDATIRELEHRLLRKKRVALGQVKAQQAMLHDIRTHTVDGQPLNPRRAEHQIYRAEARRLAIRSRSFAMLNEVLERFHSNAIGMVRHKAELRDLVRELFGEDSGKPAAKELADAWTRTAEMLRQRFNAAGGDIGKMENWGLPQSHDTRAVRDAGYSAWRDAIVPMLDRQKMTDRATGLPMAPEKLELALRDTWQAISTDGWNGRSPGTAGKGALANQRSDSRFLQFKDADSWMAYQQRFGAANPFDAMMNHVNGMARDIGLMETLGPSPAASLRWLKDTITKAGHEDLRPGNRSAERANRSSKQIDRLYGELTGANGRAENRTISLGFSIFRNIETAAKLGGAVLKKPVEFATAYMTRLNNGISTWSMIPQFVEAARPLHDQAWLIRATGIAEEASSRIGDNSQSLGAEYTHGVTSRLASATVRLSGLGRFTEANRWMAGMGFVSELTANAGKGFGDLRPAFRRALEREGVDATGWDAIRATPLEQHKGAGWLLPQNVADAALGDKLYGAIHHMVDMSVPAPTLGVRAWINSNAAKGTLKGEMVRSMGQFKAFPIAIVAQHLHAIMEHYTAGRSWHAVGYAGGLFMTTTLMGALTLELEALKRGEDPRAAGDAKFWAAASLQGGGWGLMGDFIHSTENHFGGGLVGSIAGPVIGDVGNLAQSLRAKNPGYALTRQAIGDLPGQSLWYSRLAFQRIVADQAQSLLDPHYASSWSRIEKRVHDENSNMWWRPGHLAPDRAPDLSNAMQAPQGEGSTEPVSAFGAAP